MIEHELCKGHNLFGFASLTFRSGLRPLSRRLFVLESIEELVIYEDHLVHIKEEEGEEVEQCGDVQTPEPLEHYALHFIAF